MERCLKVDFEVVGGAVTERKMSSLGFVASDVVAGSELGFGQVKLGLMHEAIRPARTTALT